MAKLREEHIRRGCQPLSSYPKKPTVTRGNVTVSWMPDAGLYKIMFPQNNTFVKFMSMRVPRTSLHYDGVAFYIPRDVYEALEPTMREVFSKCTWYVVTKRQWDEYKHGTKIV
jgi:hypothetical protein